MLFYISLSPQRSLGCESHRLEVSGPGGCEVYEKPCGGKRGISSFNLFYSPETAQLCRENSHIDIKVVVFYCILQAFSHISASFPVFSRLIKKTTVNL